MAGFRVGKRHSMLSRTTWVWIAFDTGLFTAEFKIPCSHVVVKLWIKRNRGIPARRSDFAPTGA